jgi:hypothetical protein
MRVPHRIKKGQRMLNVNFKKGKKSKAVWFYVTVYKQGI